MKTFILNFLFGVISVILNAQDIKVEKVYYENSDALHYEYEYYIGKVAEVDNIVSRDSETGLITDYDPGGHQLSDVVRHGYYKEYYPDGTPKFITTYVNGKRKGKASYYYESGKLHSDFEYSFDVIVGDLILYFENENKMETCTYKGGKRVGKGFMYNEDGSIFSEINYLPNKEANYETQVSYGNAKTFYPSGKVNQEGRLKISYPKSAAYEFSDFGYTMDGEWKTYDEAGTLLSIEPYTDDLIEGTVINYFPNGNKKEEIECIITENNGEKISVIDGTYKSYHENGKLNSQGLLVSTRNDDGTYSPKKYFVWRWYDENGSPKEYQSYIADEVKNTITQPAITEEENIDEGLTLPETKRIILSKYGKNYFFHFEEALKPYIGCKLYYNDCPTRQAFYEEVDIVLGLIYKKMEACDTKDKILSLTNTSDKVYGILKKSSENWDLSDFDIATSQLKNKTSLEEKLKTLRID